MEHHYCHKQQLPTGRQTANTDNLRTQDPKETARKDRTRRTRQLYEQCNRQHRPIKVERYTDTHTSTKLHRRQKVRARVCGIVCALWMCTRERERERDKDTDKTFERTNQTETYSNSRTRSLSHTVSIRLSINFYLQSHSRIRECDRDRSIDRSRVCVCVCV